MIRRAARLSRDRTFDDGNRCTVIIIIIIIYLQRPYPLEDGPCAESI